MLTDLEIGRAAHLLPIEEVAASAGIAPSTWSPTAGTSPRSHRRHRHALADQPAAKYVVITAVTPTPLGEGKTTTAIGLAQGLPLLGHRPCSSLRQPSLGPTFGIKGGAAGAGYSQVVPMEAVNLHLTGDFHAVTSAHNLLAAMVDNHLHHGNELGIDARTISWRRVLDVNDRALRNIVVGPRRADRRRAPAGRLRHHRRQRGDGDPVAVDLAARPARTPRPHRRRLHVRRAAASPQRTSRRRAPWRSAARRDQAEPAADAGEHAGARSTAGPFGNIATGNSSVVADLLGIRTADYLLTEAGFGSDMGAERFFDVKCRVSGLRPDAAVLVVTVRALKTHSGRYHVVAGRPLPPEMLEETPEDVRAGAPNLRRHIEIVRRFGVPPVVAVNAFPDRPRLRARRHPARSRSEPGPGCAVTRHVADGGKGALELAALVVEAARRARPTSATSTTSTCRSWTRSRRSPRRSTAPTASTWPPSVAKQLARFEVLGYGSFPVVIAKTHLSISSDPTLRGRPDRLADAGARGPGRRRRRLRLRDQRRDAHDARACRSTPPPSGSTSTTTATSSACPEPSSGLPGGAGCSGRGLAHVSDSSIISDLASGAVPSPKGRPPSCSTLVRCQPARQIRPLRDDPRGVEVLVHGVVMPLDLAEVDGVAEPRGLEQVARVRPQHRHLAQLAAGCT